MSVAPNRDLVESAQKALGFARGAGASDAYVVASRSREVNTTWRDGKVESGSEATPRSVFLGLFVDGKYGTFNTSDLRPQALEKLVTNAAALVKALAKDPHRKLPDPKLYQGRNASDLELFDPAVASITAEQRLPRLKALEEAARSAPGADKITTVTCSMGDSTTETYRISSNGFEGGYSETEVWTDANTTVKDDDGRRPEDWAGSDARFVADLPPEAALGRESTKRALERLGAKKIGSGTMTMLVEARTAGGLLRHLIGPMSGNAIQQKASFYEGQIGKPVANKAFSLTDDPFLKRGLGSRLFDGEGMSTKVRPLIDKGVLRTYLLDVYYASKLGLEPTTARTTNLVVTPGTKSLAELTKEMKNGILVTAFLGGNSNATTGVFSLGLSGFHIVNGERKEPIAEMNLSGKHLDFWSKLVAVGNDPYVYSSTRSPSLMFDGASIAGK